MSDEDRKQEAWDELTQKLLRETDASQQRNLAASAPRPEEVRDAVLAKLRTPQFDSTDGHERTNWFAWARWLAPGMVGLALIGLFTIREMEQGPDLLPPATTVVDEPAAVTKGRSSSAEPAPPAQRTDAAEAIRVRGGRSQTVDLREKKELESGELQDAIAEEPRQRQFAADGALGAETMALDTDSELRLLLDRLEKRASADEDRSTTVSDSISARIRELRALTADEELQTRADRWLAGQPERR